MNKNGKKQDSKPQKVRSLVETLRLSAFLDDQNLRYVLIFLLAFLLTLIIVPKGGFIPDYYSPGDVASRDVKAPRDLLIPDLPLTEKKRAEAEEAVLPLYDYSPNMGKDVADRLRQFLSSLESAPQAGTIPEPQTQAPGVLLGIPISDSEMSTLKKFHPSDDLYRNIRSVIEKTLSRKIVANIKLFETDRSKGIVVRDVALQKESRDTNLSDVVGLEEVQEKLRQDLSGMRQLPKSVRSVLSEILPKLARPNLTFNKNETEARKTRAREEVKPFLFQIKKGEMIVRVGERVTEEQIKKLKALRDMRNDYSTLRTALGLLICILSLLFVCHRFAKRNISKYRLQTRDILFLASTFLGLFILIKVAIFVSSALESAFPYIDSSSYYYLFPFAVGAMLVRIVLNSETAFIFAVLSSLFMGILFGNSLFISFYVLAGSLVAAHWVRHCKERATLYLAGLRLSLINVVLIFAIHLIAGRPLDIQLLYKFCFGLGGGLVCAVIVNGTVPLVEAIFKYTTDIKLLELANMNTPVLRELMVQAPGTYHHSVVVGNLVEGAAEAINANPLLARVAAYYHDIGKIKKPLYFVENTGQSENRHDKLSPSMSALILMAHVKDGVELARENRLGGKLTDILRQHHGTALIKFFYDKAKNLSDPEVQQVDERDYRYPGPKPQTREAALIMLADAVEAASRTLTDPTPARIQGMVQKIINNIFIDGQLDECELTLKDIHNIAKSFNRILSGIFHNRIDYPEPVYKEREKETEKRKTVEDSDRQQTKEPKDKETGSEKGGSEDLKRLGMS